MFDEQKEAPSQAPETKPEDIFDDVDSAPATPTSTVPQPQFTNSVPQAAPTNSQSPDSIEPVLTDDPGSKMSKIMKVVGVVVGVLLLLSVGTWYALSALGGKTQSATKQPLDESASKIEKTAEPEKKLIELQPQVTNQVATPEATPVATNPAEDLALPVSPAVSTGTLPGIDETRKADLPAVDTDKDGLSDAEEGRLGTNPLKTDSDEDALSDFDEVNVYGTDPLKVDTDSDSFSDGSEVSGGYNPRGSGKLMLDTSTSKYKNN